MAKLQILESRIPPQGEEKEITMGENNIRNVKPGDCVREKASVGEMGSYREEVHSYLVLAVYPHHVLAADTVTGARRSICYGDLIVAGLEKQSPDLEALRKNHEDSKGEVAEMSRGREDLKEQ